MENIFVESDKSYYQGFILTEQEFRRTIDTISEQLGKANTTDAAIIEYEIKFENGVIAKTQSLDEIFSLENSGSGEIIRIDVNGNIGDETNKHSIKISFRNNDSENESNEIPVNHKIKGKSKDWVFVTSSLIEERVKKVKRSSFLSKAKSSNTGLYNLLMLPFMIILLIGTLSTTIFIQKDNYITEIESKWKANEISDPIEVLLVFERHKNDLRELEPMKYVFGIAIGVIFLISILYYFMQQFYPIYNFCWGDYLERFQKKEKFRKGFITIFIIGIVVSIIGGVIANYIGK